MSDVAPAIELVPVDQVAVINPRIRNRKAFKEIVTNIQQIGLKRPITVAKVIKADGSPRYELVCGQGRLEAFKILGQAEIPAIVIETDREGGMVMSLVENCARRQHRAIDLLHDIKGLKDRGYDSPEIGRKTGLSMEYVVAIIRLIENGEHRLVQAVEAGQIPVSIAAEIAQADDAGVQAALQSAYESKLLRGQRLIAAKRVIEQRRRRGKDFRGRRKADGPRERPDVTPAAILKAYHDDADRKRLIVQKAERTKERLMFVTEALRSLFSDPNFLTLLRAEELESLPLNIADRIRAPRAA